jgi:hypothetical protein
MDSLDLDFVDTRQIAIAVCRSHKALQNDIKVDKSNPTRGVLQFHYADLQLVRVGRNWLARRADLAELLNPAPTPTTTALTQADLPPRRPGRPRKATPINITVGGAK